MIGKNRTITILAVVAGILIGLVIHELVFWSRDNYTVRSISSPAEEGPDEGQAGDVVSLSDEELEEFGIEVATAGPGRLQIHKDLTGEIVIDPDRLAHIVPRFPGVVRELRKTIGDRVSRDEVIAIIESNESLATYEVRSLIDGTVIDMHMTRGELIVDEKHAVVVADLSYIWANLSVYQQDLPYVRKGQPVSITAGPGIPETRGKTSYVSPVMDEVTRTVEKVLSLVKPLLLKKTKDLSMSS